MEFERNDNASMSGRSDPLQSLEKGLRDRAFFFAREARKKEARICGANA
jgi:hypothetical protein